MKLATTPNEPSPIRWSGRIGAFDGTYWHRDGRVGSALAYRVYRLNEVNGLELLPTPSGRRQNVFVSCVATSKPRFAAIGFHRSDRSARRACVDHLRQSAN
jgi:hypothetical protein